MTSTFARQPSLVSIAARPAVRVPAFLAVLAGATVPLKAARLDVAGLSLYATYLIVAVVAVRYWRSVLTNVRDWFLGPICVVLAFAAWAVVQGAGLTGPIVTSGKIVVALGVAAAFAVLLVRAERWVYRGLLAGVLLSVAYMAYQWISSVFFGFALPFTTSAPLSIGLGLSRRYGFARVTGFTEEPSFIATILVGATLLNVAYAIRTTRPNFLKVSVLAGAFGLAMCTSNNLFATLLIVAAFWPFIRRRRIALMLGVYYFAVLVVTPFVLLRDTTFYARFSAYDIFLGSDPIHQVVGRGIGSYPNFFAIHQVQFDGQDVASLASIWGGWLFEGGIVLVGLVIWWLAGVVRGAGWREGLALIAVLLMLSNYNSPWWPIVSLALAQCLVQRRKETSWTTKSTSRNTVRASAVPA